MLAIFRPAFISLMLASAGAAHADLVSSLPGSPLTPPATAAFSNSNVAVGTTSGVYNFLDQWNFALTGPTYASSITTTFDFDTGTGLNFGITNLQVKLVGLSGTLVSWLNVNPPSSGFTSSVALTPASPLGAGNYTLEVRGTVTSPGSYGGTLIASPVPLPAALPLLLVGLGALGVTGKRSRRSASQTTAA